MTGWKELGRNSATVFGPVMLLFQLPVSVPEDTFLDMEAWGKGIVFINGFNIGRYSSLGPIRSLYAPSPLFRSGINEVLQLFKIS